MDKNRNKRKTISRKLWSIVIFTTIIFSLFGSITFIFLKYTQNKLEDALSTRTYNLNLLRAANVDLYQINSTEKDLYMVDFNSAAYKNNIETLDKNYSQIEDRINEFETKIIDDVEKDLLQDYREKYKEFNSLSADVRNGSKTNNQLEKQLAMDFIVTERHEKFLAVEESLDKIGDYYVDRGLMLANEQRKTNKLVSIGLAALIGVGILIIYLISYRITKNISVNVAKITSVLNKVKEGDIRGRISINSGDELEFISDATNDMLQSMSYMINNFNKR